MELYALERGMQRSIEKCWEDIGIQLEIDYAVLTRIKETHHREGYVFSCDMAFRDMILIWLKQKSAQRTWLYLVEALERLKKFPEFTDHLRRKYCKYIIMYYRYCVHVCIYLCLKAGSHYDTWSCVLYYPARMRKG